MGKICNEEEQFLCKITEIRAMDFRLTKKREDNILRSVYDNAEGDAKMDVFNKTGQEAREKCFLLWNGLGGYCSLCGDFSVNRADAGVLVAAVKAPNERITLVHQLEERLLAEGQERPLTALEKYTLEGVPSWQYKAGELSVFRQCAMAYGENTTTVVYEIENQGDLPATFRVTPYLKFAPKETALEEKKAFCLEEDRVTADGYTLFIHTQGEITPFEDWKTLAYPADEEDGRPGEGLTGCCCRIDFQIPAQGKVKAALVFSTEDKVASAQSILEGERKRLQALKDACPFSDPVAKQLAVSADSYIAKRDSTQGKTILAGYPLFSDWGRDTMIALPGCCLSTGRYEDAKNILRTFLLYEKDGLVPNLFPEGGQAPMYNTVDAALLLIEAIWLYYGRTKDIDFIREAFPTMERIIAAYRRGTHHNIGMDTDGLIYAGEGYDQVTWMDVRIEDVLPTPRHGKPVEINAYWYNALKIMAQLAPLMEKEGEAYETLAEKVKTAFLAKFYMPEKGYLKDVLSGTEADEQLRCNQVWAISMSYSMLPKAWEEKILQRVKSHLLTPCGLRTLSPEDPQYQGHYGGSQFKRDMAYHQGTTWVFPMGAYLRGLLKVYGKEGAAQVRQALSNMEAMLREGCAGQLPEIYDGDAPQKGKGCYAQAWSVGEILRVYEDLAELV